MSAATMRQLVFGRYGDPAEVLLLHRRPVPEPGPGEVRVRMRVSPVNPSDVLLVQGRYGRPAAFSPGLRPGGNGPASPVGFEGVGVVDAAGLGVPYATGTRVAVSALGTWAEYLVTDAGAVLPVPPELSDEVACQLTINPVTAHLLLDDLGLEEGELLLLTAAASAVGRMVLQLAGGRGLRCLCLVRDERHRPALMAAGAEAVLVQGEERLAEQLAALAEGRGIAAVLDAVGGPTGTLALQSLREGGQFVSYGLLSGEPLTVAPEELIFRDIALTGFWLPERLGRWDAHRTDRLVRQVTGQLLDGRLSVPEVEPYDLADAARAVRHSQCSGRTGKAVLTS
ncbi:zinc-dependent alcohol dehydrogenase family protein [Streptomyces chrestomyceticus]|uniref:zinc-dependent alcohol dehydrogenase family protein n=1 Tax=Streptomyces chrestomyceticus TaxID=68185 RepID=UPI0037980715